MLRYAALFFVHLFVNLGMIIAILPVAGIPLPTISYGGTIMIISFVALSLVINADINHNV